jgi:hypothetical protein
MSTTKPAAAPLVMQLRPEAAATLPAIRRLLRVAIETAKAIEDDESRLQALTLIAREFEHSPVAYRDPAGTPHEGASTAQVVQQARADEIQRALGAGRSQYAVAHLCGMTRAAVQQALRRGARRPLSGEDRPQT